MPGLDGVTTVGLVDSLPPSQATALDVFLIARDKRESCEREKNPMVLLLWLR